MIDPVSIGIAFSAAQSIVSTVKSALNTGKDVYSVMGEVGKFLNINSDIHKTSIELKLKLLDRSDAELQNQALQTAMMAQQMSDYRRQLKDLLYWSGNSAVWDNMEQEHTRLIKEKRELERQRDQAERKKKQELVELVLGGSIAVTILIVVGFFSYVTFTIYIR